MIGHAGAVEHGRALRSDVCVIGAGAAGISIARELATTSLEVIALESGGFAPDQETQDLCRGQTLGAPQWPLHTTRLRFFGGSTNHWGGICRPFDEIDLLERPWVPHSGWPLSPAVLHSYYPRAFDACGLPPYEVFLEKAQDDDLDPGSILGAEGIAVKLAWLGGTHFGYKYRTLLEKSSGIRVILHANACELVSDAENRTVERVEVRTLEGNRFFVASRAYVLACGAIENARLLLLSNSVNPRGLGNHHDLVGRHYMDHPSAKPFGLLQFFGDAPDRLTLGVIGESPSWKAGFSLSSEIQQKEKLLNSALYTWGMRDIEGLREFEWLGSKLLHSGDDHTLRFLQRLGDKRNPVQGAFCWLESEQAPNPESRVMLTNKLDHLGQRRIAVDWRLSDLDYQSMARSGRLYAEAFARSGMGRVKLWPWLLAGEADWWKDLFPGGWHAMGTTRMAEDPRRGVVDPSCKVFGLDNLYVAGSSLFPAGGYDTPTVKLVALALRLADHLKAKLSR